MCPLLYPLGLQHPLQRPTVLPPPPPCSAVFALENTYTTLLDFGGINSGDAEGAIKRADKGGMVSAKQLRGLVTLLEGMCCVRCYLLRRCVTGRMFKCIVKLLRAIKHADKGGMVSAKQLQGMATLLEGL